MNKQEVIRKVFRTYKRLNKYLGYDRFDKRAARRAANRTSTYIDKPIGWDEDRPSSIRDMTKFHYFTMATPYIWANHHKGHMWNMNIQNRATGEKFKGKK